MIVAAPKDEDELRHLLYSAVSYGRPTAIRYPRGSCTGVDTTGPLRTIPLGKAEVLKPGSVLTVIAIGTMVAPAMEAVEKLNREGIRAGLINARFAKPLDEEAILKAASFGALLTVEENALQGGFGSAVLELLEERGVSVPVRRLGVPDEFIEHGTQEELRSRIGLDSAGIEAAARSLVKDRPNTIKLAF